jgi:hypothetical protein
MIEALIAGNEVLLEQKSRTTLQLVVRQKNEI